MPPPFLRILPISLALAAAPLASAQFQPGAATPPVTAGDAFEAFPTLSASAILKPEFLSGPNFTVRDAVPTFRGVNSYTIDSDFGVFEADGNQMLMRRVREIGAIAQMQEMSRGDEFANAAAKAATSPLAVAEKLVTNPVGTISGVPKGAWKFLNRAGQSLKEIGEGRKPGETEGGGVQQMIGLSRVKRDIALKLGVDPYSTNEVFQRELNKVAWPAFAGGFTVKLGMAAVSGGAGIALSAANWTGTLNDALKEKDPADLRLMNLGKLLKMDVPREDAVAFLNNPVISPTNQLIFVAALEQLDGVRGRPEFLRWAAQSEDEHDAFFFQQCAQLMAKVNATAPLTRITNLNSLPVCLTNDGTVIVPIQWDYVVWTPMAARFADALKAANFGAKSTGFMVVLTGVVSPMAGAAMTARGINFAEKQLPNPLN
jgi:hypothetical protein